jgi:hypothetical protein
MDLMILKKKLSSYRTEKGQLRGMNDEILLELLRAWENWTGSFKQLAKELGLTRKQLAPLVGKAKKILREHGGPVGNEFQEITQNIVEGFQPSGAPPKGHYQVELVWETHRIIRFTSVQQLAEFLSLVA